jgi:aminoglycoside phosphotransferase (APT) family kinase protein
MLQQPDIAHYLLSLDAIAPSAVVDEELAVVDVSRRNGVFLAVSRSGDVIVVKQAGPHSAATLAHEAQVLSALERRPALAGHVPEVVHHDPGAGRLVLRTARGGRDWRKAHRDGGRHALEPARQLGRLLATVHAVNADEIAPRPAEANPMWALDLPEPDFERALTLSQASRELVALIQHEDALCDTLRALAGRTDAPESFMHGDLRWDNCLRLPENGSRRRTRVLLLDWELAGRGDPAFDVGTMIAEYIVNRIESVPVLDGTAYPEAGRPIARSVIHAFWTAYCAASARSPTLRRVAQLVGVRLLQAAVERTQDTSDVDATAVLLLRSAGNLLLQPELAALVQLGLRK